MKITFGNPRVRLIQIKNRQQKITTVYEQNLYKIRIFI